MLSLRQRCLLLVLVLVLGSALISTAVAWRFDFAKELGPPLWWRLYSPLAAWAWWRAWGHLPAYRHDFTTAASLPFALAMVLLGGGLRWRQNLGQLRPEPPPGKAAAAYGTPRDLLRSPQIGTQGDGVVLGKKGRHLYRDRGDGHVLVLGPPRAGKGVGNVIPTALNWQGSLLVHDPKGEIAAATRRWRRTLGPTFVLDATRLASDGFNPLLELRTGPHLIGDAQMAAGMIAFAEPDSAGKDKVWDKASARLLTALIAHVRASDEPTLAHLARAAGLVINRQLPPGMPPALAEPVRSHIAQAKEVRDSVNFTLSTSLAFLEDALVLRATASSSFRASDLMCGEQPVTVYLTVPPPQTRRLRPLTRLLLQTLLATLTEALDRVDGVGRKRHRLLCLLDEFHRFGDMDVIRDSAADLPGYGIRLALVCQDVEQLRAAYGPNQSLGNMCSTVAVIPGLSPANVAFVRELLGRHTVIQRSRQFPAGRLLPGNSQAEAELPVVNPRELLERPEAILVLHRGSPRAVWLEKLRYFAEPAFQSRHDPPASSPPAEPGVAPGRPDPEAAEGTEPWHVIHSAEP